MIYLDSSFLISYLIKDHIFNQASVDIMRKFVSRQSLLGLSSLTLDELWYGYIRHFSPSPSIILSLETITLQLLNSPEISLLNTKDENSYVLSAFENIKTHNLKPRDAFHLSMMHQWHIGQIATFDRDFKKIPSLKIYP